MRSRRGLSAHDADERGRQGVKHVLRNDCGFSLMEIMVSVIVFSVAIVFLYHMLFSGRVLIELEGERRMALRLAEYKLEELKHAGYSSSGDDTNWTSVNMDAGEHPEDPTVVLDDKSTEATGDDLVGSIVWAVKETSWVSGGAVTRCKMVELTLDWPEEVPRDRVRLYTLVGK